MLRSEQQKNRGSIPDEGKIFSVPHSVKTGSGVHPAAYPVGTYGFHLWDKTDEVLSPPLTSV
jgi:hypothetical protein